MFRDRYLPYLIVLITLCSDPFIWYTAFGLDDRIMCVFFISISFLFLAKKKVYMGPKDYLWLGSWIMVFLYINIHGTFLMDTIQIVQSYGYLFKMFFLFVLVYAIKKDFPKILHLFFKVNIIIMYASVVLFFLLIIGIELPSIEFYHGGATERLIDKNWLYPLGVVMDKTYYGNMIFNRIAGLTDEPGQLALLITWLVILNEFTLKSKSYRRSLIFCGIFTFSLGFLISIALIGFYFIVIKLNNPVLILKYMATSAILIFMIYSFIGDIPRSYINSKILSRLIISSDSNKIITGDNRSADLKYHYNSIISNDRLLFGYGVTDNEKRNLDRDFTTYGFVSFIMRYIPLYLLIIMYSRSIRIILLLIILANFIQRPGIHFINQMICLTFIYYAPLLNRIKDSLPVLTNPNSRNFGHIFIP